MSANNTNSKVSNFVNSQVPFFVRNDHRTFVTFLEYYYKYLEQNAATLEEGKVIERSRSLLSYMDIDTTIESLSEKLYDKFLLNFPKNTVADRTLILKHAKDFYLSKGNENSVRFLLRALYNKEITFYYPKKDVLRASDGKWYIQKSLRVNNIYVNDELTSDPILFGRFIGTQITGNVSGAKAIVESVNRFYEAGTEINEISITNIQGTFGTGEKVSSVYIDGTTTKNVYADILGSRITDITLTRAGSKYFVGDNVIISGVGVGARAQVSRVSTGNLGTVAVTFGGAGYQANDVIIVSGGGLGSGANLKVGTVISDNSIHSNIYSIMTSTINLETNTQIGNTTYSNLNPVIVNPYSNSISNSASFFTYANTGPVNTVIVIQAGVNYTEVPTISVVGNTRVQSLGILGRMQIVDAGQNYKVGDVIEFINITGGYGTGAIAQVTGNVAPSNGISEVKFTAMTGFLPGGSGYDQNYLPRANVITTTGNGANIVVRSLLGYGATFSIANTTLGAIEEITLISGGEGYTTVPTIDLTQSGDGTATAIANVSTGGLYTYPGRYINDDGQVSAFNFLQNRDYYQNFSYVIRINQSLSDYRATLQSVVGPTGMKLFGEYVTEFELEGYTKPADSPEVNIVRYRTGTYRSNAGNIFFTATNLPTPAANDKVYVEFLTSNGSITANTIDTANLSNGIFVVSSTPAPSANTFYVQHFYSTANANGNAYIGIIVA